MASLDVEEKARAKDVYEKGGEGISSARCSRTTCSHRVLAIVNLMDREPMRMGQR